MATAPRATGCHKCGRTGHWSRDCPSQLASENPAPGGSAAATPSSGFGGTQTQRGTPGYTLGGSQGYKRKEPWRGGERSGNYVAREKPAKAPAPPRRYMPKLTPDLLLGADGLGYVLEKIPRQVTIKGRGHEVEDLKSLLEAYVRWHQTLLPYYSYSQFVEKVEKVGSTKRVRLCVRELRSKIERGEKPTSADVNSNDADHDGAPDTRWESDDSDGDMAEDHADPPVDVLEELLRDAASIPAYRQAEAAPAPRPVIVIGEESTTATQQEIKEEQRSRMEANKAKALERARARKLELEKSNSSAPA